MPVPAEIMVREAATGPYPNREREEIRLSCKMPFCSQLTITRSSGPCREAAVHPPVGSGVQPCYVPPAGPSIGPVAVLDGGQDLTLLPTLMVPLWRHLPLALESPGKTLRRSWPKNTHLSSPGVSFRVDLD